MSDNKSATAIPTPVSATPSVSAAIREPVVGSFRTSKICASHRDRLAVVYVRQSSAQQVIENQESRLRQYELANHAVTLGWFEHRVLVIDEDQARTGKGAEHRSGFQLLMSKVALEQVGLILGLEMSRLARSSKDWHHLLELCGLFGTLLADQDGIYDPADSNDRLLLGLKGTMSEFELITMRNRLERGRLHKAERGELFTRMPVGYVRLPSDEIIKEPDEQARSVVQLVFDKFEELGSVNGVLRFLIRHGIQLGLRPQRGPRQDELLWQRPALATLVRMLNHPIYAGAYSYGRRVTEHRAVNGELRTRDRRLPRGQWKAFKRDALPAYITWEQYEANLLRLRRNRSRFESPGAARNGDALLAGILYCGNCGHRLHTNHKRTNHAYYGCMSYRLKVRKQECRGLRAAALDELIVRQLFKALEPASLELSLQVVADAERERQRLHEIWAKRFERARYEADRAERQFQVVEPENRLVGRSLEKKWEAALRKLDEVDGEWQQFQETMPAQLTEDDRLRILAVSQDVPALWDAEQTTNADRKEIVRCLIDRVVAFVDPHSERTDVTIHWQGGFTSQHELLRPVSSYWGMAMGDQLRERVTQLHGEGCTASQIAAQLNQEGMSPPRRLNPFSREQVWQLLSRFGLIKKRDRVQPDAHEWPLATLAERLGVEALRLRNWARKGWVHGRQTPTQGLWILWADAQEVRRLERLKAAFIPGICRYPVELTTPKPRPKSKRS